MCGVTLRNYFIGFGLYDSTSSVLSGRVLICYSPYSMKVLPPISG